MESRATFASVAGLIALSSFALSCEPQDGEISFGPIAVEEDADRGSDAADSGSNLAEGSSDRVAVELERFVDPVPAAQSSARAYRADSQTTYPDGPNVRARPGDLVLENGTVRAFVERRDETISPCSYGGNLADAVYKRRDGTATPDVLGEICPILNAGLTVRPTEFEVVRDGSESGYAAVAATGNIQPLDFLNIRSMAPPDIVDLIDLLPFEPSEPLPLTVTIYYMLEHGSNRVRMVTAFRNDGSEPVHAFVGHLVKSGGHGSVFNPLNRHGGFGADKLGRDNIDGTPVSFLAFAGEESSYAYIPEVDPDLSADLPVGGGQVSASGVGVVYLGETDLADLLLATRDEFTNHDGVLHLDPGESTTRRQDVAIGDGGLASAVDPAYRRMEPPTGRVRGLVRDDDGDPATDVRVTAVSGGRAYNQDRTDPQGRFEMRVPEGDYRIIARHASRSTTVRDVRVGAETSTRVSPRLPAPALLRVDVETPAGESVPARVSVRCVGSCPNPPTSIEQDVSTDPLPDGYAAIEPTDPDGRATVALAPGSYRVSVTRGLEWSVWPDDAPSTRGRRVELTADSTTELDAEIARVVRTEGALGGDFHVHGVRSSDSVVTKRGRVLNFVSEGVDVMVSTDHDVVTDYRPVVADLGVGDEIVALRGDEITTADIGHFNAFPLPHEDSHRAGGALNWGRGPKPNLPPEQMYAWAHDQPGKQVVQMNHPASESTGFVSKMKADVLHGTTHADPSQFRLPGGQRDPETGDTGYWSDDFNAIEVMNGPSIGGFWPVARWWMTMIGRGFTPTGTAVTDTHELYSSLGGTPRTYAFVGDDHDTPETYSKSEYVETLNAHRAIGTNGPFFRLEATNGDGGRARIGETLRADDGSITLEVRLDLPVWMHVDRIDVFSNVESVVTDPGEIVDDPIPATKSVPVELDQSDRSVAARGDRKHFHKTKRVDVDLQVSADAYVIVVVRASRSRPEGMRPVVPGGGVVPFAFSNPIYVDADGGGYDDPHLRSEAESPPNRPMSLERRDLGGPSGTGSAGSMSREQLDRLMDGFRDRLDTH